MRHFTLFEDLLKWIQARPRHFASGGWKVQVVPGQAGGGGFKLIQIWNGYSLKSGTKDMPIGCGQAFCASQQESLDFHSGAISFQGWTFSHFICSHRIAKLFIASLHPIVTAFRLKQAVQGGEQQDPSENHAVNATSYSIGRSILQSCSACGPTSKGDAKGERKNEPKEELEAKTWPIKSSEEDEVMGVRGAAKSPIGWSYHWSTPMRSRDWNPASPKFDHCTSGGRNQKKQRWAVALFTRIHFNELPKWKVNKSLSGETEVEHVKALVGAQDPHGHMFVCSLSVATVACLRWRLLLIDFGRRKGWSQDFAGQPVWHAPFPAVPLCLLCGSLHQSWWCPPNLESRPRAASRTSTVSGAASCGVGSCATSNAEQLWRSMQFASTRLQKPKELCWQDRSSPGQNLLQTGSLRQGRAKYDFESFWKKLRKKNERRQKQGSQQKLIAALNCNFNVWKRSFRAKLLSKPESWRCENEAFVRDHLTLISTHSQLNPLCDHLTFISTLECP